MLSATTVLGAWEQGLTQAPVQRALTLLRLVHPDAPFDALADMSIGQRDWYLLWLREQLFGPDIDAFAQCPVCSEPLEFAISLSSIRVADEPMESAGEVMVEIDGTLLRCRLPTSRDLLDLARAPEPQLARDRLLARCLLEDAPLPLKDTAIETIGAALAAADPQADVQIDLECAACSHHWSIPFDIASYLHAEIGAWARRTLREVHLLASTYGWSEGQILDLSAQRRQMYLEIIGA